MANLYVGQLQAAKMARKLVLLVFLLVLAVIIWAKFATLEEVIIGEGIVVPAQTVQTVENLDGGILKQVLVSEGQQVQKGEPVVLLDETRFAAAFAESSQEQLALIARRNRLQAELATIRLDKIAEQGIVLEMQTIDKAGLPDNIYLQAQNSYHARISQLQSLLQQSNQTIFQQQQAITENNASISALEQRLVLVKKEVELTASAVRSGAVAEMELVKLQREEISLQGELNQARALQSQLVSAEQKAKEERRTVVLDFLAKAQGELDEASTALAKITQSSKALEDRLVKAQLRAPVTGTVKNITSRSVGAVVEPGQAIMEIVPIDDQLLIETKLQPKDIGFIRIGMPAKVKFSAYDFIIYGALDGEVTYISADAQQLEDGTTYYEAHIKTKVNTVAQQAIIPGMQASVDVITGKKTVLHYWLKPLLRAKANAMREP